MTVSRFAFLAFAALTAVMTVLTVLTFDAGSVNGTAVAVPAVFAAVTLALYPNS